MNSTFYSFSANTIMGEKISMSDFKDKVVVVVNTASKCGFTPQYEGLELLYKKYGAKGLVILGFPCNQFGKQEPGTAEEIAQGCLVNYGVTFPMFEKIAVNGEGALPLYAYLKKTLPGFLGGWIKWNFTKFVIDRNGKAVKRFAPHETPLQMEEYLRKLL